SAPPSSALLGLGVLAAARARRGRARDADRSAASSLPSARRRVHLARWDTLALASAVRVAADRARAAAPDAPLLLGHLDDDGRFLGVFGPLPGLVTAAPDAFTGRDGAVAPRVVLLPDGRVVVRHHGMPATLNRAWEAQQRLADAGVPIAAPVARDPVQRILDVGLIAAPTVHDRLLAAGAPLRPAADPLASIDDRVASLSRRARPHLDDVLDQLTRIRLDALLRAVHRAGVTGVHLAYDRIALLPADAVGSAEAPAGFTPVLLMAGADAVVHGVAGRAVPSNARIERLQARDRARYGALYARRADDPQLRV
ncbi:MAG: hypothetical protein AAF772_12010, partial [Acidobacteriota bacterium]